MAEHKVLLLVAPLQKCKERHQFPDQSSILSGYRVFHNYIRPHEGLEGKTPAEACGIKVEGQNKWLTLIQNASKRN